MSALAQRPDAGFAYSQVGYSRRTHLQPIGSPLDRLPPEHGIDTCAIMHRRELLDVATWEQSYPTIDWDLVSRWVSAGTGWAFVEEITADFRTHAEVR